MLGIAAATLYAIYILMGSRIVHQAGSIASSTVVMISAATIYAGIVIVHDPAFPQTVAGWAAVVAIALVSTVLAFVTFFAGLERTDPIAASTLSTLKPVVTVMLATVVLGEGMGLLQLLGGVLILIAAITLVRSEMVQKKPKAPPNAGRNKKDAMLIGNISGRQGGEPESNAGHAGTGQQSSCIMLLKGPPPNGISPVSR